MADVNTENPFAIRQFIGIDNHSPETRTKPGHVRDMENVVPTRDGQMPRRRDGYAQIYAGTRVHSVFGDGVFPWVLFVDNGTLFGMQRRDDMPVALASGLGSGPVSYVHLNADVYWSNGARSGVVRIDGEVYPWACEVPAGQPVLAAGAGGALDAGTYQVAITYRDLLGRESGTGRAALVEVGAQGRILVSDIPVPVDSSVVTARLYCSPANGDVLYHVRDLPAGLATTAVADVTPGKVLGTQFQLPLPAGQIVAAGHGRLFVARGNVLYWSDALRYGQGDPASGYMRFHDRIELVVPVGDGTAGAGVFVAAGARTTWLAGADPKVWAQRIAYPHGAVEGTIAWASGDVWGLEDPAIVPAWLARSGLFCVGLAGGQVMTFNRDTVSADTGQRGASLIREIDGQRHMTSTVRGPMASGLAVRDRITTTVRRNGVEID